MKTTKVFFMAALALMTASCSNDDNELAQEAPKGGGIPFTATLSMGKSAATRALSPGTGESEGNIVATWITGEQVALIYKGGSEGTTPCKTVASVTAQNDGTATVSTKLDAGAVNGSEVTIIYPASAADGTTGNVNNTILTAQDGTLTGNETSIDKTCDVRKGTGKLSISGEGDNKKATVYDNNRANNLVKLDNLYSIFKFTLKDIRNESNLSVNTLTVSGSTDGDVKATVNLSSATNEIYVALPVLTAGKYWFTAAITNGNDSKPYIAKATATATTAGNFYPVTVKMATIGDVILSNGTFAKPNTTSGTPVAMIAYLGSSTGHNTYKHGLAMALTDENSGNGMTWNTAVTTCNNKSTPAVSDASSWMLPRLPDICRSTWKRSEYLCYVLPGISP